MFSSISSSSFSSSPWSWSVCLWVGSMVLLEAEKASEAFDLDASF